MSKSSVFSAIDKVSDFFEGKRWIIPTFGVSLTVIVCWLIFIVPLYSQEIIPNLSSWGSSSPKGVWMDQNVSFKTSDTAIKKGISYVETTLGVDAGVLEKGPVGDETCSSFDLRWAESRDVPCKRGWILVISDEALLKSLTPGDPNAKGRTFLPDANKDGVVDQPITWATIVLTNGALDSDNPEETRMLPLDPRANLWAHELLHGFGEGHTYTRVIPGVDWITMDRTGSILNKNLYDAGWNGAGLPQWDKALLDQYNKKD